MSNALPTTLEEMQYEILQGDLSQNPKLQSSTIPAKDKELKTQAKKIIPAINELLKTITICKQSVESYSSRVEEQVNAAVSSMEQTVKQEQLEVINESLANMESQLVEQVAALSDTLKQEYATEVNERFQSLENQISTIIAEQVAEQLAGVGSGTGTGTGAGGEVMKKKFHSKITVTPNTGQATPFKMTEIQNLEEQIVGLMKTRLNGAGYLQIPIPSTQKTSSSSVYEVYNFPIELRVDQETEVISVFNRSSNEVVIYFYEME